MSEGDEMRARRDLSEEDVIFEQGASQSALPGEETLAILLFGGEINLRL
jgi:hypothetical protein